MIEIKNKIIISDNRCIYYLFSAIHNNNNIHDNKAITILHLENKFLLQ